MIFTYLALQVVDTVKVPSPCVQTNYTLFYRLKMLKLCMVNVLFGNAKNTRDYFIVEEYTNGNVLLTQIKPKVYNSNDVSQKKIHSCLYLNHTKTEH